MAKSDSARIVGKLIHKIMQRDVNDCVSNAQVALIAAHEARLLDNEQANAISVEFGLRLEWK